MSNINDQLRALGNSINFYFSCTVATTGVILNLFTGFMYLHSKSLRKSSRTMSLLYVSLSIYDILALFNSFLFIQLLPSININLSIINADMCRWTAIWRRTFIQTPSWHLTLITFDRFRSICCPNRFEFMENPKKLFVIIVMQCVIICAINSEHVLFFISEPRVQIHNVTNVSIALETHVNRTHHNITNNLVRTVTSIIGTRSCTATAMLLFVTDILSVSMRSYIPFTLMLALNIALTRRFLKSRKRFQTKSGGLKKEYYFTATVISMNLTFFVLYMPWSLYSIVNRVYQSTPWLLTPYASALLSFLQSITFSIAYLNNLSSFFNNFLFNNIFRKELFKMFNCNSSQNQIGSLENSGSSTKPGIARSAAMRMDNTSLQNVGNAALSKA
jgi:hypothetical protein